MSRARHGAWQSRSPTIVRCWDRSHAPRATPPPAGWLADGANERPRAKTRQLSWVVRSAFWPEVESAWRGDVPQKQAHYGCRTGTPMLSRAHDVHPYLEHPQLRHRCAYRPWQIDARRPPDPANRRLASARDEGTGARFH